jgi:hypothetical protein
MVAAVTVGNGNLLEFDAAALEAAGARFDQVQLSSTRGGGHTAVMLAGHHLVEDDAPGIGQPQGAEGDEWFERLHTGLRVRKQLVLDQAEARSACLLFCGREAVMNPHTLHIEVNGLHLIRPPSTVATPLASHYFDQATHNFDNWFEVDVPVGALSAGVNEIVMWSETDEPCWEIMVASAVS